MERHNSQSRGAGSIWSATDLLTGIVERMRGGAPVALASDDSDLVVRAAAIAAISEFDLFRAAWRQWQGAAPDNARLESIFARYLHEQEIPGWVRHFARQLVGTADSGGLDPAGLGLGNYQRREPLPDLSCRFTTEILGCALLSLIVILV